MTGVWDDGVVQEAEEWVNEVHESGTLYAVAVENFDVLGLIVPEICILVLRKDAIGVGVVVKEEDWE